MKIIIETIPHGEQRYETVGDWYWEGGDLRIKVSDMDDWKYEACVAVHELVEVLLCKSDGISQKDVDDFDMQYEKERSDLNDNSEPGDDHLAPYRKQHCLATGMERILAAELGLSWDEYDLAVTAL